MKLFTTFIYSFSFFAFVTVAGAQEKTEGINFFHGTFKEALDLAKSQDKLIFMDAFTSWCGPCKRMSAYTFPDPKVGEYYNTNFINIKVDMEKEEGPALAKTYSVGSYPTLLYIDGDGKVIFRTAGMRGADEFILLGMDVMKKIDKSGNYELLYNEGKRDPETILAYIKSLNAAGKPSIKIANDYLATQKDLGTNINMEIIYEATKDADSKIFDYFIQNKEAYIKLKSLLVFDAKVYQACMRTFQKSLEFRNEELLNLAQEKMKFHSSKMKEFKLNTDMEFYARTNNPEKYIKACKKFTSTLVKNDATRLTQSAQMSIDFFRTNKSIVKLAEKNAAEAVKIEGNPNQLLLYATILKLNGNYKLSREIAIKALNLAREKMMSTYGIEQLLQELQEN
ncbi:MAG: DUF255 domain-containing protein [Saprospiraceae bacterium]